MKYIECLDNEATHVRVANDNTNAELLKVTKGNIYKVLRNQDAGLIGEEMLIDDTGHSRCSFSWLIKVDWLKEVAV